MRVRLTKTDGHPVEIDPADIQSLEEFPDAGGGVYTIMVMGPTRHISIPGHLVEVNAQIARQAATPDLIQACADLLAVTKNQFTGYLTLNDLRSRKRASSALSDAIAETEAGIIRRSSRQPNENESQGGK